MPARASTAHAWEAARWTAASDAFRAARDLLLRHRSDPAAAAAAFRWPQLGHFNWALEWFDVIATGNPAPALRLLDRDGGGVDVSYQELSRRSDAVAGWFTRLGVARGDRIMVVLGSRRELWEVLLAALKTGAVTVPCHPDLTPAEAADRVTRGRIDHVVCGAGLARHFEGCGVPGLRVAVPGTVPGWTDYRDSERESAPFVPDRATPGDDVAFCYFTSGTTSSPKLVAHTHTSYPVGHLSSLFWNGLLPGDRHVNVSSPGWAKHSWSSFFVPWNAEATVVVLPDGPLRPERIPRLLHDEGADSFCAPPSLWQRLLPHLTAATPALREATSAGEPLPAPVAAQVRRAWGVDVRDGYGQTETTALIGTPPGVRPRAGRLGLPLPGYRITLRDPDTGRSGDSGEICVELAGDRPVGVMAGYPDEPDRTEAALGRGWYATGDLAERAADGWIRVLGRRDDVFKSYGHRVSPFEAEAVLRGHPAVAEAVVVAVPHPEAGTAPVAVVVPAPGHRPGPALATELLALAHREMSAVGRPTEVHFATELPRTASGKVRRRHVRDGLPHTRPHATKESPR